MSEPETEIAGPIDKRLQIKSTVAQSITLASQQNDVPLIRELSIINNTDHIYENLNLNFNANPEFVTLKTWKIDRINPGSTLYIKDYSVTLDGKYLNHLNEAVCGKATLILTKDEEILASASQELRVLARNEWGGLNSMADLLAAFSMPNDPVIDKILKLASTVLQQAGKNYALDGYKSGSKTRSWELVSAIWSAISGLNITYALPPASFESQGQKIRSPTQILDTRLGTCLDIVLLFTACLEQAGLNPFVVFTEGHAFAGVWLQPEQFSTLTIDSASAIRKRLVLKELVVFETTLVTNHPSPPFSQAADKGERQISEEEEAKFQVAIDMRRARMQRIRPLPSFDKLATSDGAESGAQLNHGFEEAPRLGDFQDETELASVADTPQTRLANWQRQLLDLSLRNPLLNFKQTAAAIKLVCPNPPALEDKLAEGRKIKVVAKPAIADGDSERSSAVHLARHGTELDEVYAKEALERDEVLVRLDSKDLDTRITNLYRSARKDLEEGGANTLYIAFGFLVWERKESDGRKFRAPLVLVPVSLERKSIRGGSRLVLGEDESCFNTTLLQMLRQDFDLDIRGFDQALPHDDHGVDIAGIWKIVREAVKDQPGFELVEDVVLGIFSFAKYLMWKDLVDRSEQLKTNPVVKHLIETPRELYVTETKLPKHTELDLYWPPEKIFTPLPADSTQLAAVMASTSGNDFVLIGPPGTGKSQTIANMIAQNLAEGRKVLFVAEKMTALNVVYRRLNKLGLGDFCLQIHSNKAKKTDVLDQLRKAWESKGTISNEEWLQQAAKLKKVRDELNDYVTRIHRVFPNGLSPFLAMGRSVANEELPVAKLTWPSAEYHSREDLDRLTDIVDRVAENFSPIMNLRGNGIGLIRSETWSPAWSREMLEAATRLDTAAKVVKKCTDDLQIIISDKIGPLTQAQVSALSVIASGLLRSHSKDIAVAFMADAAVRLEAVTSALALLASYRDLEKTLSCKYNEFAWKALNIDQLDQEYMATVGASGIKSFLLRRKLKNVLRKVGGAKGKPSIQNDLEVFRKLRDIGLNFERISQNCKSIPGWDDYTSDYEAVSAVVDIAKSLRRGAADYAVSADELIILRSKIRGLVIDANDLLDVGSKIGASCQRFIEMHSAFAEAMHLFNGLANITNEIASQAENYFATINVITNDIAENSSRLNAWCAWQRCKSQAVLEGLGDLVQFLESGTIVPIQLKPTFNKSYAHWWSDAVVDADPVLQAFVPSEHERRIKLFSELDEQFLHLTARYVRAKLCGLLPSEEDAKKGTELGVLRRELEKKRAHKALRQLIAEMPESLTQITPCLLMSPLSIAQYLAADQALFDVVIFDEASQITVWDSIGAISRGKNVVVVGDPQQLPPTTFFSRQDGQETSEDDVEQDLSSILDECLGAGLPKLNLSWHYRSKFESLVTFSNQRFYGGGLVTFPSPVTEDRAVRLIPVVDGVYDRGGSRTNRAEALAIVKEIVLCLRNPEFIAGKQSIGVVTFNAEQTRLIEDLLDAERNKDPSLDRFFDEGQVDEPVFVKNLERVQGDERDIMFFSITYGPDKAGVVRMNFGPLNQVGGPRRLNVAITRARHEMLVYSTLRPDQIDLSKTSAIGIADLKHFLEFAERGPKALAAATHGSIGSFESPFEEAVARRLSDRGWRILPQIGVSGFRIDLGVVHPDAPGRFLAGIECDGVTYHRSATARDRDKLREQVLRNLGWEINRIWSTDWWIDSRTAVEKLHNKLNEQLELSRKIEK